jgi:hypothetical protein
VLLVPSVSTWSAQTVWASAILCVLICVIDWSLQTWADIPSTNGRRLATGALGGAGAVALLGLVGATIAASVRTLRG